MHGRGREGATVKEHASRTQERVSVDPDPNPHPPMQSTLEMAAFLTDHVHVLEDKKLQMFDVNELEGDLQSVGRVSYS